MGYRRCGEHAGWCSKDTIVTVNPPPKSVPVTPLQHQAQHLLTSPSHPRQASCVVQNQDAIRTSQPGNPMGPQAEGLAKARREERTEIRAPRSHPFRSLPSLQARKQDRQKKEKQTPYPMLPGPPPCSPVRQNLPSSVRISLAVVSKTMSGPMLVASSARKLLHFLLRVFLNWSSVYSDLVMPRAFLGWPDRKPFLNLRETSFR